MIIDLQTTNENSEFECDVCIIGTGAAGLTIASEMLKSRLKIILVEAGGIEYEPETQALYNTEISGFSHPGSTEGRFRVHGGSTTKWAGQALPLMSHDFEKRDWVANSGWPISFHDLKPYYARACQFLLVDKMNFDTDLFSHLKIKPPEFNLAKILYHFSKWSPAPNVREHYLSDIKLSENCTLLLHANVTRIVLDENKRFVREVNARSLKNHFATIKAKNFILCTGGIETARLLLFNDLGNQNDLVGRYFQDHPSAMIGFLKADNPKKIQKIFNAFTKKKLKYSTRFTASPRWQYEQKTLNMSAGINFVDENSAFQNLRDVYHALCNRDFSTGFLRKFSKIITNPAASLSPMAHYLLHGRHYNPGAKFQIGLTSEQEPDPESRVMLSEQKDALGIPLSNIKWKPTDLTHYSIRQFSTILQNEFRNLGLGELKLEPWVCENSITWKQNITDQYHHMGTARMSNSARSGVVDSDCRVHNIENFYIGSSAVFPTSGHSNPTLTIIALCMRISDKIKSQFCSSS